MRQFCNQTGEDVTNYSERLSFYGVQFATLPFVAFLSFFLWNPSAYSLFLSADLFVASSFFAVGFGFFLIGVLWLTGLLRRSQFVDEENFEKRMNHLLIIQLSTFLPATVLWILPVILKMVMNAIIL